MPKGGYRKGSGRKPGPSKTTPEPDRRDHTINVRLSNRWHSWLKAQPGNAGRLIEEALEKAYSSDST